MAGSLCVRCPQPQASNTDSLNSAVGKWCNKSCIAIMKMSTFWPGKSENILFYFLNGCPSWTLLLNQASWPSWSILRILCSQSVSPSFHWTAVLIQANSPCCTSLIAAITPTCWQSQKHLGVDTCLSSNWFTYILLKSQNMAKNKKIRMEKTELVLHLSVRRNWRQRKTTSELCWHAFVNRCGSRCSQHFCWLFLGFPTLLLRNFAFDGM